MELLRESNLWICRSNYDERQIPKVAGCRWNAAARRWETSRLEVALKLRNYAVAEVKTQLDAAAAERETALAQSRATDAVEVHAPVPKGLAYLPYQRAGIAYALGRKSTLFGDEMGLGKTIQALGIVNSTHPKTVLVVCPASLRLNWLREAQKWVIHSYTYRNVTDKRPIIDEQTFVICNYERLDVAGLDRQWDLVIVDEAHRCKNPKAKRTQRVVGVPPKKDRERVPGIVDRATRVLFLTGTPILNKPIELFPLLSALDPQGLGKNFFAYAKRYCAAFRDKYGWNFDGSSHLDELQDRLRSTIMVRRLKKDVLSDLPAKRRQLVVLPTNGAASAVNEEKAAWVAHEEQLAALRNTADLAWASDDQTAYKDAIDQLREAARVAFTDMSKHRHAVALAKVPAVIDYCRDVLESTDKLVVFAHHHDVVAAILDGLSEYSPVRLTGEDSADDRQTSIDRFQSDVTCRVIVGSIGAMGVGITLTAASTEVFAELDWVPANITQAEDRCHRIGQVNSVSVVHLVLDGSLDQRMAEVLIEKQEVADKALDNPTRPIDPMPVVPTAEKHERPREEPQYESKTKERVLLALQQLAGMCDGARLLDGLGFSKIDSSIGHSLARCERLTDRQTWLGLKLCRKYRRQLPDFNDLGFNND